VAGRNLTLEFRFADGQYERLPAPAAELVKGPVGLIVAMGPPAALAAKIATTSIPIVFVVGLDPVGAGLVASFNRPGGNATGVSLITGPLGQKRLEILREIVPR
jgi:putative ABC transport system substrate-binding protein